MPNFRKPSEALATVVNEELEASLKRGEKGAGHSDACIVRAVGRVLDSMQKRFDDTIRRMQDPNNPFTPGGGLF